MGPEAERVDLDAGALKSDPGRLADEAASISLFGGARHLRITVIGEDAIEAFTLLLAAEQAGNPVVAIAPSVKSSGKIVKLALQSPRALARSEEHTSELQSLMRISYAVFCLKKKTHKHAKQ